CESMRGGKGNKALFKLEDHLASEAAQRARKRKAAPKATAAPKPKPTAAPKPKPRAAPKAKPRRGGGRGGHR
ncbi:unnamed protein product, partial [Pedinophyceae sp. YPF-701]